MVRWRLKNIEHIALRLLALLMAVILWFLATSSPQQNLSLDQRVVTVEVSFEHVADTLEVTTEPDTVRVTVEGPRLVLPFQAEDVEAVVDLQGLGAGRHRVPVQVRLPTGVGLSDFDPREVTVVLESRVERVVAVRVAIVGVPAGRSVRLLDVRPTSLEVYGAASQVERVAYILAQTSVQPGVTKAGASRTPALPVDSSGRPVEGVVTSVQEIEVHYAIEESAGEESAAVSSAAPR